MHLLKPTRSIIVALVFALTSLTSSATQFDIHGKLIPPDEKALQLALEQQKEGYPQLTMKYLKDAAKFGNNDAKYMIGMYHLSQKEWARGYAWLNLMTEASSEQKEKIKQIQQLISSDEKSIAASIYKKLKPQYSPLANLEHRQKWARQDQVGSRIAGAPPMRSIGAYAPSRNSGGGVSIDPTSYMPGEKLYEQITDYVYEFESTIGNVVLSDLELIDNDN
ncbi:hypothetical protein [Marinicella sp. W31]|uniref:hypothetical protein n=1 Tax=Marinicella sp. W31 TaxID=3023713 RepID=UPI00375654C5